MTDHLGLRGPELPLERATTLRDLYDVCHAKPLATDQELDAYYSDELSGMCSGAAIDDLESLLRRSHRALFCRALLAGSPGVGKSTQIARLRRRVGSLYATLHVSASNELHPFHFDAIDLLALLVGRVLGLL